MRTCAVLFLLLSVTAGGCRPADITIEETPIRVVDERQGHGPPVVAGDSVRIDYVLRLPDGSEVLRQKGYKFKVGTDSVIRGIDEAVVGMRRGGTRVFTCPPHKHWGRAGYGDGLIPRATDLQVTLHLERIERTTPKRVGSVETGR